MPTNESTKQRRVIAAMLWWALASAGCSSSDLPHGGSGGSTDASTVDGSSGDSGSHGGQGGGGLGGTPNGGSGGLDGGPHGGAGGLGAGGSHGGAGGLGVGGSHGGAGGAPESDGAAGGQAGGEGGEGSGGVDGSIGTAGADAGPRVPEAGATDSGAPPEDGSSSDAGGDAEGDATGNDGATHDAGPAPHCATPSPPPFIGVYDVPAAVSRCTATPDELECGNAGPCQCCACTENCSQSIANHAILISRGPGGALSASGFPDLVTNGGVDSYENAGGATVTRTGNCSNAPTGTGFGWWLIDVAADHGFFEYQQYCDTFRACYGPADFSDRSMGAGHFRCVPSATVCIDGDIVTCDDQGNVISRTACGAPCGPAAQ